MSEVTREELIEAVKKAAAQVNGDLTRDDFIRLSGFKKHHIFKVFPDGGFAALREAAGFVRYLDGKRPLEDEELLLEFHRIVTKLNRIPTWALFNANATVAADTLQKRFGGLEGTLKRYRDWLENTEPESPVLLLLPARHGIPAPPVENESEESQRSTQWSKIGGTQYGAPMNFRGLRHAPINEQGVVFLFGMVSYELGFIVEAIHAAFPDCEAKRCIDSKSERWQRVRIEFEFRSSNFLQHAHPIDGCDVIVCWEHDWRDCPLEVVELRKLIQTLEP